MRVIQRSTFVVLLLMLFALPQNLNASHAQAVDISYVWITGNTYQFTVRFYRDCAGIPAPAAVTLDIASASCSQTTAFTLLQSGTGTEVSPLCPAELGNSTCSSSGPQSQPGVEEYIYIGTFTFPLSCNDWVISWDHCCRNQQITNLSLPDTHTMYVETTLDNTNSLNNSSPVFSNLPVPFICNGQQFCYNLGATDPNGDSLSFTLVNALETNASNIPYVAPANATYPILEASGGPTNFNASTGTFCVTPNAVQTAVITILVTEWRNGVIIGTTMRDMQIVVQNCTNQQPNNTSGGMTNVGPDAVVIDSNSITLCPGDSAIFELVYQDPNGTDTIIVTSNATTAIPGSVFDTSGVNPVTASFAWVPGPVDTGFYSFTVTIQDDGCPILGSQVYAYDIYVAPSTFAGTDTTFCASGSPLQLNATGGSSFTWTVISGDAGSLSCTNCKNPSINPNVTTVYEVVSNLPAICKNRDTVVVVSVPDFIADAGPPDTICRYGAATLLGTGSPALYAPYTFVWDNGSSLSSSTTAQPSASPLLTTLYHVTITSSAGCVNIDSVEILVSGVAPQVDAGADQVICPTGTAPLSGITFVSCDTAIAPCGASSNTSGTIGSVAGNDAIVSTHDMIAVLGISYRKQYIYTVAEMNAAGIVGITNLQGIALDFNVVGAAPNTHPNVEIKMGCTSLPVFPSSTFLTGLTTVMDLSAHTPPGGGGFYTYTFTREYVWDGTSNLVVEFCANNLSIGNSSTVNFANATSQGIVRSVLNGSGQCGAPAGSLLDRKPVVQWGYCQDPVPVYTYNWNPGTYLDTPTSSSANSTPPNTIVYSLEVSDGNCTGVDQVAVRIDSTIFVAATADTNGVCATGNMTLNSAITGAASPTSLPCGANGTTCAGPNSIFQSATGNNGDELFGPFFSTVANARYANKVQYIFTATELQSLGMISGTISQLSLNIPTFAAERWSDMEIWMGCTAQNEYITPAFIPNAALTQVFTVGSYQSTNSWNTFNITPYDWDGAQNLVVQFCLRGFNGQTGPEEVQYTSTGSAFRTNYLHTQCNCSVCADANGTPSLNRANMLFTICPGPPGTLTYAWTGPGLSDGTIPAPTASGVTPPDTFFLTVTGGVCPVMDTIVLTSCVPLPAEDITFRGERIGEEVMLYWTTLNENNTSFFQVERSRDGKSFESIGSLVAAGFHLGNKDYQLLDPTPYDGVNFYRVKQVDGDGAEYLTEVIEIRFDLEPQVIAIHPNPIRGTSEIFVDYFGTDRANLQIKLIDLTGRTVKSYGFQVEYGENNLTLPIGTLPAASYFLRFENGQYQEVQKILVIE